MAIDELFKNRPGLEGVTAPGTPLPPSNGNLDPEAPSVSPAEEVVSSASVAQPRGQSQAWTDLITRADVIVTEVGDLARSAVNLALEKAFWPQDIKAFEATIVKLEKFTKNLRRARQARLYMTHPDTQNRFASILDRPGSLESFEARESFLLWIGTTWRQYAKRVGPMLKENHPDLV